MHLLIVKDRPSVDDESSTIYKDSSSIEKFPPPTPMEGRGGVGGG